MLSTNALVAAIAVCLLVALFAAPHWLVGLCFLAFAVVGHWSVAGVLFDAFDLVIGALALLLVLRGLPRGTSIRSIPHLRPWLLLSALLAISYVVAPEHQQEMTDPVRILYQVYRYAIRATLLYPICSVLIDDSRKFDDVSTCVVGAAIVFSVIAMQQGYGGRHVTGPFGSKNALGAALGVPFVLAACDLLAGQFTFRTLASVLILARGVLFASSRGAFGGILVGTLTALLLLKLGGARPRLAKSLVAGLVGLVIALAFQPDLFERPMVSRVFTTTDLDQETFQWRVQHRWPHFVNRIAERPWLGWQTNVDESLGPTANTPHNGYLSIAVEFGVPALLLYLWFTVRAGRDALRVVRRARDPADRLRAAKIGGAIAYLLVHNFVESVYSMGFVSSELWLFCAVTARMATRTRGVTAAQDTRARIPVGLDAPVATH